MSRNGGEVTTKATEPDGIAGVSELWPVSSTARPATWARVSSTCAEQSESKMRVFFAMMLATSRLGGTCRRRSLILSWDLTDTAWLGGIVYTEKNPGEWPVS